LLLSVTLKAWSTFALWNRYRHVEYWTDRKARGLFLLGKVTPLTACGAIVALAYVSGRWWLVLPAWSFFVVVAYGVVTRINAARRSG